MPSHALLIYRKNSGIVRSTVLTDDPTVIADPTIWCDPQHDAWMVVPPSAVQTGQTAQAYVAQVLAMAVPPSGRCAVVDLQTNVVLTVVMADAAVDPPYPGTWLINHAHAMPGWVAIGTTLMPQTMNLGLLEVTGFAPTVVNTG